MFNQKKSKLMQTKGQLMKSLNAAFSFAPPSILSLTILMFLLYHNDTIMKNEFTHDECVNQTKTLLYIVSPFKK